MDITYLWAICLAALGLGIGSFLNVAVLRLNAEETILGRSHCMHCKKTLPWFTLVPVLSYIGLGGKCYFCRQPIAAYYALVEASTAALFFTLTLFYSGDPVRLALYLIITALCVAIFLSDYLFFTIPDAFTLPGIVLAAVGQLVLGTPWWQWLLGLAIGSGVFGLQYAVSHGRWVGSGDIRFGAMMGAVLAWPNILVGLFLAYVLGAVVALPLLLRRSKKMNDAMPFGTFLAVATISTLLFGDAIVHWYVYDLLL